ncbi:MAG: hypothetical protein HOQ45_10050, partial [Nocardioidaceae bacterium]|nr:hypothetical protein [Nocardioidaceae bacterium]
RARCRDLSPAACDALRRVNAVLGVRARDPDRQVATRRAAALFTPSAPSGRQLTLPADHHDWAVGRAREVADDLRADGYPVHGSLDALAPLDGDLPTRPRTAAVLEALLGAVRTGWAARRGEGAAGT